LDTTRYWMSLLIVPLLYPDLAELLNGVMGSLGGLVKSACV
jgi:hypothetical protein